MPRTCFVALIVLLLVAVGQKIVLGAEPSSVKALKERAAQGDAKAQFKRGVMYYNGHGVPQDYTEALW
jgi:TPR repeat protein